jgi:hypothetical protein
LKAASLASTTLEKAFRGTTNFSENAVLLICKETIGLQNFLVDSTYPWKLIQVDLSVPKEIVENIQDILQTVHTMRLIARNKCFQPSDVIDFLISLFMCTPNLTSLTV